MRMTMKLPKQSSPVLAARSARSQATNAGGTMSSFPIMPMVPSFNQQELLDCYMKCGASKEQCDSAFKDASRSSCRRNSPNIHNYRNNYSNRLSCISMAESIAEGIAERMDTAYQAAQSRCRTTGMAR